MTDNSNFVIRWEVDNATERLATGKVESGVFCGGGFKWTAAVERCDDVLPDRAQISLRCDLDNSGSWKCEARVGVGARYLESYTNWSKASFCFIGNRYRVLYTTMTQWDELFENYKIDDKVTFEFRIKIISSERSAYSGVFAAPNRMSNVVLKIGDERLHVFKEILALHSPVFETLFFGDFAEKGKEEVELKDVVHEEFVDLLNLIYLGTTKITDRTVQHLLKLADQFQMERVLDLSKEYLAQSTGLDVMHKLLLADQYRLISLRELCLRSLTSIKEMKQKLMSSPEFANFSLDMKGAICERISELPLQ